MAFHSKVLKRSEKILQNFGLYRRKVREMSQECEAVRVETLERVGKSEILIFWLTIKHTVFIFSLRWVLPFFRMTTNN